MNLSWLNRVILIYVPLVFRNSVESLQHTNGKKHNREITFSIFLIDINDEIYTLDKFL